MRRQCGQCGSADLEVTCAILIKSKKEILRMMRGRRRLDN